MESNQNATQDDQWKGSKAPTGKGKLTPAENSMRFTAPFSSKIRHVAGFTNFINRRDHPRPANIYARSLFAAGNGYPLWSTSPIITLPLEYHARGICIGDVGVLVDSGNFRFIFNIFLPRDHPVHNRELPSDFVPLEPLDSAEIRTIPNYFAPGSIIVSSGVEVSVEPASDKPAHIAFKSSEPEAAVLVLRGGASRQDISTNRIHQYVRENALNWCQFFDFHASKGFAIPNGAIYVVTGHDKASSCAMGTFPSVSSRGVHEMTAGYYYDLNKLIVDHHSSHNRPPDNAGNHCIFLRGIRIGLGSDHWLEHLDELPESMTPFSEIPPRPSVCDSDIAGDQASIVSFQSGRSCESYDSKSSDSIYVERHPFHPSDIVGQIMLSERPESFIALADDHVWSIHSEPGEIINAEKERSFIVFRCRQGGFISDFTQLISQIFLFHDILDRDGMLTLVRNSKTKNQNKSWLLRLQRIFVKNGKQDLANWMDDLISDLVLQGEDLMSDNYRLYDYT